MAETNRSRRVNEAIRQVLSEAIAELKDPRVGFVTITEVRATKDIAQATVFLSVLGSERDREQTLAALESARGLLQARINREMHFRRTPRLVFEYDPAVERGVRLSRLLDELTDTGDHGGSGGDRRE